MVADPSPVRPTSSARTPQVVAVAASSEHGFSKQTRPLVHLVEGLGVEGDAHLGRTVQHLSRVRRAPHEPNLRQVHLIQAELFEEVHPAGHRVLPGQLGENVTTTGLDLLALPVGTVLLLGDTAEVQLTGLRNPCRQIDAFQPGLLQQVLGRADRRRGRPACRRHGRRAPRRGGASRRPGDRRPPGAAAPTPGPGLTFPGPRVVEPAETTQPRTSYVRLTICPSGRTSTSRMPSMRRGSNGAPAPRVTGAMPAMIWSSRPWSWN